MIRSLENKDINKIMDIWLESTIKAHDFIGKKLQTSVSHTLNIKIKNMTD